MRSRWPGCLAKLGQNPVGESDSCHILCYTCAMSTTLTVRIDEQTEHELTELAADSSSRNAAIVEAIHEAYRRRAYARMRDESEALRDDPEDGAEIRAVREAMGADDAW